MCPGIEFKGWLGLLPIPLVMLSAVGMRSKPALLEALLFAPGSSKVAVGFFFLVSLYLFVQNLP